MTGHGESLCSIIIPVFNQLSFTKQCLQSIVEHTRDTPFEIVVVDNGSSDGTSEFLASFARDHANTKVISFDSNRGYAEANNEGAKISSGTYFAFLNNDTIVTDGWLKALFDTSSRDRAGLVGAKLLYPKWNRINHAGYVYDGSRSLFYLIYELYNPTLEAVNKEREFQAVLGACMFIKRDLFTAIGGFTHIGLEDIDLCLRVREAGYRVLYSPKSVIYHYGSVTIKGSAQGSIPLTSTADFLKRWPPNKLKDDHLGYYESDGYRLAKVENGLVFLDDLVTPSNELVKQAISCKENKQIEEAKRLLLKSIELFPANSSSLVELLTLYSEEKNLEGALDCAEQLVTRCPVFFDGYIYTIRLNIIAGRRERASELLGILKGQYDVPSNTVSEVEGMF